MKRNSLILFWLLLAPMPFSTVSDDLDDIIPDAMDRFQKVSKILVPIPEDVLTEGMFYFGSYIIPLDSETELCRNHSALLFDAFLNNELWAIKMLDASSKFGAGLLDGRIMDLGNYDMCVGLEAPEGLFTGQNCVVETKGMLPKSIDYFNAEDQVTPVLRNDVMFSVCVPSSCTAQDVRTHMDVILNSVNVSAILYNTSCSTAAPLPLEKADVFAIFILLSIVCLITTSTIYEYSVDSKGENQLFSSFSLRRNIRQLLAPELNHNCLPCLHGLRVIGFVWLILGHRVLHLTSVPLTRYKDVTENYDSLAWAPLLESPLSVEIFFLISGLLVTYNFLKDQLKGNKFNYASFLFNRYKRLTPSLAMMVLLNATLFIHLSDGPIWNRIFSIQKESCQTKWWLNLLYINNYYGVFNMCMIQSWYLAADFQMHVVCPLVLIVLYKLQFKGLAVVSLASFASIAASAVHSFIRELPAEGAVSINRRRQGDYVEGYFQAQYRASTFLMGVFLAYFIFKVKQDQLIVKPSKVVLVLTWLLSAFLITGSIFGITYFVRPDHIYNRWIDPIYWVLHRHTLVLGVAWVIFVCTIGFGGVVNQILSWKAFVPLSRLSYAVYLVQFFIQDVETLSTRTTVSIRLLSPWYFASADILLSVIAAAVLYLAVEAPFVNIFKYKKSK